MLGDLDIARRRFDGALNINPFSAEQMQPCSYDVRLDSHFKLFTEVDHIDPKIETPMLSAEVREGEAFMLYPGEFVLGSTQECITLGPAVAARFEGKSSIGRLGLLTHVTAGFIDAGFSGHITLELVNVARMPLKLWPGMKIGQLCFFDLLTPSSRPYGAVRNHYQHQRGPTASRAHLQFQDAPCSTT